MDEDILFEEKTDGLDDQQIEENHATEDENGFGKNMEPELSDDMRDVIERSQKLLKDGGYDQIIMYKSEIMKKLVNNVDILRTLHNEELESEMDRENLDGYAYRYVNIFDFLKIPGIQSTVKNYICFGISEIETYRYNDGVMTFQVLFRTVSHEDDYKTDWGVNRQDLLAAIIKNSFDWSNDLGMHLVKSYDREKVYENGYYYREFTYEIDAPNSLQNKLKNGVGYIGR